MNDQPFTKEQIRRALFRQAFTDQNPDLARIAMVDGTDALAYLIIRPAGEDRISVEANATGISQMQAAHVLRKVAEMWEEEEQ